MADSLPPQTVGLLGYGEVGQILAEDLRARDVQVLAYDVKLDTPETALVLRAHAESYGVKLCASAADLAGQSELLVCAVTASQAIAAARAAAAGLSAGSDYLDFNSASPGAKRQAALLVEARGAHYVEAAVMTSVPPYRIKVPMLLGGPHAARLANEISPLGFFGRVASERLGVASATKMCRSVIIKGMEAMMIESLSAARHYGVEDAVLASLAETFPGVDWERQATYFFQRVIEHGRRRSEEMIESAQTVSEAGLSPHSALGTVQRQGWVADLADAEVFGSRGSAGFARSADWRVEADRLLLRVRQCLTDSPQR